MQHWRSTILFWVSLYAVLYAAAGCERNPPAPRSAAAVFAVWGQTADQDKRRHLAEEMIRDRHLIGMTRDQVVAALGEPSPRQMSAAYGDPKYVVAPNGVDDLWLCIHVVDGKVARAELRSD